IATHPQQQGPLVVVRYDGYLTRPVLLLFQDPATRQYLARTDANHDGRLDERDGASVMALPRLAPNPLRGGPIAPRRSTTLQPGGDILALNVHPETWGVLWRYRGLDPEGTPRYRLEDCRALPRPKEGLVSPYTYQPDASGVLVAAVPNPDGG